ncbi:hypothetical protein COB55_03810 [Candidatus Wolfebacteria bacterium]|nr:MAG: hypothetical protein COB55_03810 [Candidatus Wolfebacteria bacterium]
MKFKVGQKVRIRKDCVLYKGTSGNPKNTNGIIITINKDDIFGLPIRVMWENNVENIYSEEDLEYWYKQPLRDLLEEIKDCDTLPESTYRNIENISNCLDSDLSGYLNKEELKPLRDLWEKWNKSKYNSKNK